MSPVQVGEGLLELGDRKLRLVSGSIHFWRHPRESWPALLDAAADLGFEVIDTYVSWSVHEMERGRFDFTGDRDLGAFLDMVGERGMYAAVRPGPATASEQPEHGFPRRVVENPAYWALRCSGIPYTLPTATHHVRVPSFASEGFMDEVATWYDAVAPILAARTHPHGPVVAVQVDNEMGYFFQTHPYALDYHPEMLEQWRQFVLERRGGLDAVNRAYGLTASTEADLQPPRDAGDRPEARRVDWMLFREEHLRTSLARLAGMLRARGLGDVVLFHNDYARVETPMDQQALEESGAVDIAGVDVYSGRRGGRWVADTARHLAGSSKLPHFPEMGAGWISLPWVIPSSLGAADQEMVTMAAFLAGARACNFYMLVERDRWYGSPIARDGGIREEHADFLRRFNRFLRQARLDELTRDAPVLLLEGRAEARAVAAAATLGDIVPAFSEVMPFDYRLAEAPDPRRDLLASWRNGMASALRDAGVDFNRASGSLPPRRLSGYRVIAVPVIECLDRDCVAALSEAAAAGSLVCSGPGLPRRDEGGRQLPAGGPEWRILAAPGELGELLPAPMVSCANPDIECFRWTGARREVIGLLNHSEAEVRDRLTLPSHRRRRSLWPHIGMEQAGDPELTAVVRPFGAAVWEISL